MLMGQVGREVKCLGSLVVIIIKLGALLLILQLRSTGAATSDVIDFAIAAVEGACRNRRRHAVLMIVMQLIIVASKAIDVTRTDMKVASPAIYKDVVRSTCIIVQSKLPVL
jgi:hypothetical protein